MPTTATPPATPVDLPPPLPTPRRPVAPAPVNKPAPAAVDLASESIAGEEDPGAALDDDAAG